MISAKTSMDESYTEQDYTCVKVHPHLSINPLHVQKPKTGDRIAAISRLVPGAGLEPARP